ncbi:MAG TPA: GNAT family N-acetyltransferase [Tepidisphaeraceae bacterium]|jgi:tagatose 1,6-diphosphate aldolase
MQFFTLDNAVDRELQLVAPAARWIDDMLLSCQGPGGATGETQWTRGRLLDFLRQHPDGIDHGDPLGERWPGYYLWMHLRPNFGAPLPMAGTLSLRLADTEQIRLYYGHIGFGVFPAARGRHYAERATRLVLPLARRHGMTELWITANPDNTPSRRTCQRLGAEFVDTVDVPRKHPLYARGEKQKCRYRLGL